MIEASSYHTATRRQAERAATTHMIDMNVTGMGEPSLAKCMLFDADQQSLSRLNLWIDNYANRNPGGNFAVCFYNVHTRRM